MRAACAEVERAHQGRGLAVRGVGDALDVTETARERVVGRHRHEPLADRERDLRRAQPPGGREQHVARLVALADDGGCPGAAVEQASQLILDEPALLLHHHDALEPLAEPHDALRL